jgi:hypothetical protein
MITDYDTTVIAVRNALLNTVSNPTKAHEREASRRAHAIMDLSCELLLNAGATLHFAERFASALIMNSRKANHGSLTAQGIATAFKNRIGQTYIRDYQANTPDADVIYERGIDKAKELVSAPLAAPPVATVQSAQRQGSIAPAPNNRRTRP